MININSKKLKDEEIVERVHWRETFLKLGGVNHLYEVLLTTDIEDLMVVTQTANQNKKKKGSRKR